MGKATERRERKLAKEFDNLATNNPVEFQITFKQHLEAWSYEAIKRSRSQYRSENKTQCLRVFEVLEKAKRIVSLCGDEVKKSIGDEPMFWLSGDCENAVRFTLMRKSKKGELVGC
jgi:hypothetical protein